MKPRVKVALANKKGMTLTAEEFKFAGGLVIAAVLSFSIWWFGFHNQFEQSGEQSAANLFNAIQSVCSGPDNSPQIVHVSLPQSTGLLAQGAAQLQLPFSVGNEPYQYLYFERFPPNEPGICTGSSTIERGSELICNWNEDLPWSSNLITTMIFDAAFTVVGTRISEKLESDASKAVATGIEHVVVGVGEIQACQFVTQMDLGDCAEFAVVANVLKSVVRPAVTKAIGKWQLSTALDKTKLDTDTKGLLLSDEITKETVQALTDKGVIQQQLDTGKYTVIDPQFVDIIKKLSKVTGDKNELGMFKFEYDSNGEIKNIYADPRSFSQKFVDVFRQAIQKLSPFSAEFESGSHEIGVLNTIDEVATPTQMASICDNAGLCTPSLLDRTKVAFGLSGPVETKDAAMRKELIPDTTVFTADKEMIVPIESVRPVYENAMSEAKGFGLTGTPSDDPQLVSKLQNDIADNIAKGNFGYRNDVEKAVINQEIFYRTMDSLYAQDYTEKLYTNAKNGLGGPANYQQLFEATNLNYLNDLIDGIKRNSPFPISSEEASTIVGSIRSTPGTSGNPVYRYPVSEVSTDQDPLVRSRAIFFWVQSLAEDPKEAKLLKPWFEQKTLVLPQTWDNFINSVKYPLGYTAIRFQDLFTPLGGTYIYENYLAYYARTQGECSGGELCLQLGFLVRPYSLPNSCINNGVNQTKLVRNSVVATDPGFYLVSPCFANLKVYKQGDTVYVEPKLCKNHELPAIPNYCFATAEAVNFYWSDEIASTILAFASAIPGAQPLIAGTFILDALRESAIRYPFTYEQPGTGPLLLGDSWTADC